MLGRFLIYDVVNRVLLSEIVAGVVVLLKFQD